jgi:hypothetical protein
MKPSDDRWEIDKVRDTLSVRTILLQNALASPLIKEAAFDETS